MRLFIFQFFFVLNCYSQTIPISKFAIDQNGLAEITVKSTSEFYYILKAKHSKTNQASYVSAIKKGENGTTILKENIKAYPLSHYEVQQIPISKPIDLDSDGIDDISELKDPVNNSPLNAAKKIEFRDGVVQVYDEDIFKKLSYKGPEIDKIDPHLVGLEFMKFYIVGSSIEKAQIYFMNSETHKLHETFKQTTKINTLEGFGLVNQEIKGEIVFHPNLLLPTGGKGQYRFEFEPNDSYNYNTVQMAFDLITRNMPFLKNNLAYYPMPNAALPHYFKEKNIYDASRIPIILEKDIYKDINYIALNKTEGYGLLKILKNGEFPTARDIVILNNLPNDISRTAGIISTTPQTPLSHVNLRAIQDQIPNAYIKDASSNKMIISLLYKYVYFKVNQTEFEIRESSLEEVNQWHQKYRPTQSLKPKLNLDHKKILPLNLINFNMSDGYGTKCANLAEMRRFGLSKVSLPDGYGIPFYFYVEFMKHNDFYSKLKEMLNDNEFKNNTLYRTQSLLKFKVSIENGEMPTWMLVELNKIQKIKTDIRCRSSSNNEDLTDFSSAGLYDSKTHKNSEGPISKTIKEVYASLWNFRAFEEREFYKIDHFETAMGVLCHPNFKNEKLNGVAVSTDPVYFSKRAFYINNQKGEDLVTNPELYSIPEEILLDKIKRSEDFYQIINYSNLSDKKLLMSEKQLELLGINLKIIYSKFKVLYKALENDNFAVEIEYKITSDNKIAIKQARPWVGKGSISNEKDEILPAVALETEIYPNPIIDKINLKVKTFYDGVLSMYIYDINGKSLYSKEIGYYLAGERLLSEALGNIKGNHKLLNLMLTLNYDQKIHQNFHKLIIP